jgi:spermidine synthase
MSRARAARRARRRRAGAPAVRVETSQGAAELVGDPRRPAERTLFIGGLASSAVDLDDPERMPVDYLHRLATALEVLLPRGAAGDVVHLGGGAFALPRLIAATRPAVRQEVYELEPALVALAREHLRLRRGPALTVRVGDARELLARRRARGAPPARLVVGDAFTGTEVPAHLAGPAFAAELRAALAPDGVHLVNVVDAPPFAAADAHAAGLATAFAHVTAFGAREVVRRRRAGNVLLAASAVPLPTAALARALAGGPHPSEVVPLSSKVHVVPRS